MPEAVLKTSFLLSSLNNIKDYVQMCKIRQIY